MGKSSTPSNNLFLTTMDVDQEPLQPHVPSSQSDVETQPVYWKDSMDEDLRAAVMSVVGRHVNGTYPSYSSNQVVC